MKTRHIWTFRRNASSQMITIFRTVLSIGPLHQKGKKVETKSNFIKLLLNNSKSHYFYNNRGKYTGYEQDVTSSIVTLNQY